MNNINKDSIEKILRTYGRESFLTARDIAKRGNIEPTSENWVAIIDECFDLVTEGKVKPRGLQSGRSDFRFRFISC
jgi:hypothetical protein